VVLRFFVVIPPAKAGGNSSGGNSSGGNSTGGMKENAIRNSNELPHGFSLWQEKDDGSMGL
jgi:hypothetical protein